MHQSTINAIAAGSFQRVRSYKEAAAEIHAIETQLGLPKGAPIYNLRAANARLAELQALRARASATAKTQAPKLSSQISFAKLKQLHAIAFGSHKTEDRLSNRDVLREIYLGQSVEQDARAPLVKKLCASANSSAEYQAARKELSAVLDQQRNVGSETDQRARLVQDFANAGIDYIPGLESVAPTEAVNLGNPVLVKNLIAQKLCLSL